MTGNEPIAHFEYPYYGEFGDENKGNNLGLTIRQEFARSAMQGMLSNNNILEMEYKKSSIERYNTCANPAEFIVKQSVDFADALIKELNKTITP